MSSTDRDCSITNEKNNMGNFFEKLKDLTNGHAVGKAMSHDVESCYKRALDEIESAAKEGLSSNKITVNTISVAKTVADMLTTNGFTTKVDAGDGCAIITVLW